MLATCCAVNLLRSQPAAQSTCCAVNLLRSQPAAQSTCCAVNLLRSQPAAQSTCCAVNLLRSQPAAQSTCCAVNLLRSQPARPRRHLERAEEIDGGTLKLAKSRKLSIQTHVFLTGNPLSNVYRIRRGKVYFDRGMTPPVKSVCKTMPSRGRLRPTWGRSALRFPADSGRPGV